MGLHCVCISHLAIMMPLGLNWRNAIFMKMAAEPINMIVKRILIVDSLLLKIGGLAYSD